MREQTKEDKEIGHKLDRLTSQVETLGRELEGLRSAVEKHERKLAGLDRPARVKHQDDLQVEERIRGTLKQSEEIDASLENDPE